MRKSKAPRTVPILPKSLSWRSAMVLFHKATLEIHISSKPAGPIGPRVKPTPQRDYLTQDQDKKRNYTNPND